MPIQEPDSSSYQPIEQGHEEPSQDGSGLPLSSTINPSPQHGGGFSISKSSHLWDSQQRSQSDDPRDCCTSAVHNRRQTAPRMFPAPFDLDQ